MGHREYIRSICKLLVQRLHNRDGVQSLQYGLHMYTCSCHPRQFRSKVRALWTPVNTKVQAMIHGVKSNQAVYRTLQHLDRKHAEHIHLTPTNAPSVNQRTHLPAPTPQTRFFFLPGLCRRKGAVVRIVDGEYSSLRLLTNNLHGLA